MNNSPRAERDQHNCCTAAYIQLATTYEVEWAASSRTCEIERLEMSKLALRQASAWCLWHIAKEVYMI